MFHSKSLTTIALLWLCCAIAIHAAEIAGPKDIPYPGTLALSVDLTDLDRRLFLVREWKSRGSDFYDLTILQRGGDRRDVVD